MMTYVEIQQALDEFRENLIKGIKDIPTDNGLKKVGSHIYVAKLWQLQAENNWSPEHFDIETQKKYILENIQNKPLEASLHFLKALCEPNSKLEKQRVVLHNSLRREIKALLKKVGYIS